MCWNGPIITGFCRVAESSRSLPPLWHTYYTVMQTLGLLQEEWTSRNFLETCVCLCVCDTGTEKIYFIRAHLTHICTSHICHTIWVLDYVTFSVHAIFILILKTLFSPNSLSVCQTGVAGGGSPQKHLIIYGSPGQHMTLNLYGLV